MRRLTSIVINEVLSHTDPPLVDAIELFNPSASSVDISWWFLSDRRNDPRKFRIPDGTVIEPEISFSFLRSAALVILREMPPPRAVFGIKTQ